MSSIHSDLYPGTAVKTVIEEHQFLDELLALIEERMELENQHLRALKTLRGKINPKWYQSTVSLLASPLLDYFDDDIQQYENAHEDISLRFDALQKVTTVGIGGENGFVATEMPGCLQTLYADYERRHNEITSVESLAALKAWWKTMQEGSPSEFEVMLPSIDRKYRQAVTKQQHLTTSARKWYTDNLPGILERHQQRAEAIKAFLCSSLTTLSLRATNLSTSCSTALNSTELFSSLEFIAPRYAEKEQEKAHLLLKPVQYHNFMLHGQPSQPVFGLGAADTLTFVNFMMDEVDWKQMVYHAESWRRSIGRNILKSFDLENRVLVHGDLAAVINSRDRAWFFKFAFWSRPPLFPISGKLVQKSPKPPRAQMSAYTTHISPMDRRDVMELTDRLLTFLSFTSAEERAGTFLAHSNDKAIRSFFIYLWFKWDFQRDCPLPDGIKRQFKQGRVRLVDRLGSERYLR